MEQQADYIRRIEIKGLWARFNIQWDLRPDVNILSGINGVGKDHYSEPFGGIPRTAFRRHTALR